VTFITKLLSPLAIATFWPSLVVADVYTAVITNLDGPEIPAPLLESISDTLRTAFIEQGRFNIVERERLEDILEEQGLVISGCVDMECAVTVGKLVNATHVVVGKVLKNRTGGYHVNVRLVDIELGTSNAEFEETAATEEGLVAVMRDAATSICEKYQVKCKVVQYDGKYVVLPVGTSNGVREGSRFKIVRVIKEVRGENGDVVFRKTKDVGECVVNYVEAVGCQAKMVTGKTEPAKGDLAVLLTQ